MLLEMLSKGRRYHYNVLQRLTVYMYVCMYSWYLRQICIYTHVCMYILSIYLLQSTASLSDDGNQLLQEFDVTLDISEDDGKGNYTPVSMDKDCFKLRQNVHKKVAVAISQPNTDRPLLVER